MPMENMQELFVHELSDMYDAEQKIVQMLPELAKECHDKNVSSAFQQHEQETRQQIQNLEQCFQALGTKPEKAQCSAVKGMKQEHDAFLKEEQPAEDILLLFNLGGAAKTESYEIASYKGLVQMATLMGQKDCVRLLQDNLHQEQAMEVKVEQFSKTLGKQMIH